MRARFPNNCTGSINISSAAPAYALTTHTNSFCTSALLVPRPRRAFFRVPLIIIAKIVEAKKPRSLKNTGKVVEGNVHVEICNSRERRDSLLARLDCNIVHFSRNPFRSSGEHRARFQIPVLSSLFVPFPIFRLFRQYLRRRYSGELRRLYLSNFIFPVPSSPRIASLKYAKREMISFRLTYARRKRNSSTKSFFSRFIQLSFFLHLYLARDEETEQVQSIDSRAPKFLSHFEP